MLDPYGRTYDAARFLITRRQRRMIEDGVCSTTEPENSGTPGLDIPRSGRVKVDAAGDDAMGRWQRRKAERQRRSAQRRAHGLPDAEPHDAEPHEAEPHEAEPHDAGDDALDAISASLCPECGEPVRWSMAIELLDHDPELFGRLEELLGPELLAETDVWTCPACGASGVVIDEDGYDPEGFAPDPLGSDPLDSDPLGSASYDPKEPGSDPEESDPDESTGLDDLFCRACRSPLEWLDPARVRSIDRAAYLRAQEQYGAEALLEGDAAACWTCGRITFYPDDGRWFR